MDETSNTKCSTDSVLSQTVAIIYGVSYALFLVIVSLYSFRFLNQYNIQFNTSRRGKKLKIWIMDIYKRRKCYLPIIAHVFDQITDVAVAIQFYDLARNPLVSDNGQWGPCNGLNMWYLFIITVGSMVVYRLISSLLIYRATEWWLRFIIQLFDIELLWTLYVNYLCHNVEPCNPQRWIIALEAALESTPQSVIQFIYLAKTGTFVSSPLITISFVSSLFSIVFKLISDDRTVVIAPAKKLNCKCKFGGCMSFWYIFRVIWRVLDVTSNILLMVLVWIIWGGNILTIKVAIEFGVCVIYCFATGDWQFLFVLIATVVSAAEHKYMWQSYRWMSNFFFILFVTLWLYEFTSEPCWKCTEPDERNQIANDAFLVSILIYVWIAVFLSPISYYILVWYKILKPDTSTSRDLEKMIESNNYDGIIEMQLYCGQYGIYDKQKNKTLLMLAMKQNNAAVVSFLLNKINGFNDRDENGWNMLDHYLTTPRIDTHSKGLMTDSLIAFYKNDPNIKSRQQFTIFLSACYNGEIECVKELVNVNPNVLDDVSVGGLNGATWAALSDYDDIVEYLDKNHGMKPDYANYVQYAMNTPVLTAILPRVQRKYPTMRSVDDFTSFLCATVQGNIECMARLLECDPNVLDDVREGQNALNYAINKGYHDIVTFLTTHYNIKRKHPGKNKRVLLLGTSNAGKTTIFKKIKQQHGKPWNLDERREIKNCIQNQIINQMKLIIKYITDMDEEQKTNSLSNEAQEACSKLLAEEKTELTIEIADAIKVLWHEAKIRDVYDSKAISGICDSTAYFWDRIDDIIRTGYLPDDHDIILCQSPTGGVRELQGLECADLSSHILDIFDVCGSRKERERWKEIDCVAYASIVDCIVFVVSLSCYDEVLSENENLNAMSDALELWTNVVGDKRFKTCPMTLILNKTDLFETKIVQKGIHITLCPEFASYEGDQRSVDDTMKYITSVFLNKTKKDLIASEVCAIRDGNLNLLSLIVNILNRAALRRNGLMV
eukprot:960070_1